MALTIYDVLRYPVVSEKTNFQVDKLGQYVFEVSTKANKTQIKEAVEALFDVDVVRVNTIIVPAKRGRRRRRMAIRAPQRKKAMVKLALGQTIDVLEGVR
tara:strand:+ start:112 stop:411 length:300 start_codon:yes stop_codon:yes gene_type:complete